MSSRSEILKAVHRQLVEAVDLPELNAEWIEYPDPLAKFAEVLESVGGRCVKTADREAACAELANVPAYAEAKKIVSLVPGIGEPNVDFDAIGDPHDLEDVDFAVLPGRFAVAENGAVWVTDSGIKHRVIFFLPQHVALSCPRTKFSTTCTRRMIGWRSMTEKTVPRISPRPASARLFPAPRRRRTSNSRWSSEPTVRVR